MLGCFEPDMVFESGSDLGYALREAETRGIDKAIRSTGYGNALGVVHIQRGIWMQKRSSLL
jgi:hypothetical protein